MALVVIACWFGWHGWAADWQPSTMYERMGEAALDWGLAGLAATCYARAGDTRTRMLPGAEDPASDRLIRADLIHDRLIAARILASANRPSAALAMAQSAHQVDPANMDAVALMWRLRCMDGAAEAAKRELRIASHHTEAPEIGAALAACLLDEGALGPARGLLDRALEADSRLSQGWLQKARLMHLQGSRSDALRAARKAWQSAAHQPAIRRQARAMMLETGPAEGPNWAGRSLDYYHRAAWYWIQRHAALLVVLGAYVAALFWPALADALKSTERDPLAR